MNEDIVQKKFNSITPQGAKNMLNELLEGRWSIGKPKRHNQKLVTHLAPRIGGFPFITLRNM
jgi:hypothetical protein